MRGNMQNRQDETKLQQDAYKLIEFGKEHTYLNQAFYDVFAERLIKQGYVDASYILESVTRGNYYSQMKDSRLQRLFAKSCITSENIEVMIEYLENILGDIENLGMAEEEALVFWIFLPYYSNSEKRAKRTEYLLDILREILKIYITDEDVECRLDISDGIVFDRNACWLESVESVEKYARDIFILKKEYADNVLFYRGHSRVNYFLRPGIKRVSRWVENENIMYQEILVRCAQNFTHCQTHLDYLVEMQHYGLPTRLLDITENPLVAMYFACCSNRDKILEVIVLQTNHENLKYAKCDTVALLSALPTLSCTEQETLLEMCNNGIAEEADARYKILSGKLAAEVKSRNPAFEPKIKKEDLKKNVFVTPIRNNRRIIKQDGAFILCGLGYGYGEDSSLDGMRCRDNTGKRLVLAVKNKDKILKELDVLSVNKAALFPEIDDVAEYIRNKYQNQ